MTPETRRLAGSLFPSIPWEAFKMRCRNEDWLRRQLELRLHNNARQVQWLDKTQWGTPSTALACRIADLETESKKAKVVLSALS